MAKNREADGLPLANDNDTSEESGGKHSERTAHEKEVKEPTEVHRERAIRVRNETQRFYHDRSSGS